MEEKYVNGTYEKSLIIMSECIYPQIYYPIKNRMEFNVDPYDFKKVKDVITKFHDKLNIIIDSRLEYIILAVHINFPDYCLVYDVNNNDGGRAVDSYVFLSNRNNIDIHGITIYNKLGRKLIDLYMFVKYYCRNILWKTSFAREVCDRSNCLIDILKSFIY